jgi:uncharacterized protein (TIGR02145 family)
MTGTASVNAQVLIGSASKDPHAGSILDLASGGQNNLGLLLPNVALTNDASAFVLGNSVDDAQKAAARGMVVYNTVYVPDGRGLYVWDGSKWLPMATERVALVTSFEVYPKDDPATIVAGTTKDFWVEGFEPADAAYKEVTWEITSGGNKARITAQTATTCAVQGIAAGDATLTVSGKDGNVSYEINITVEPLTVKSFVLDRTLLAISDEGQTGTITAKNFIGADDQPFEGAEVSWAIVEGSLPGGADDDDETANQYTVTSGGITGTFTVRATVDGISRDCSVTIHGCPSTVTDSQGNTYYVGFFGAAGCWMTQNLRTTADLTEGEDYMYPGGSKQSYYEEDHGLLYKWHAAKNACPAGWHVMEENDCNILFGILNEPPTGAYDTGGATATLEERLILTDGRSWTTLTGYSRRANDGGLAVLPVGYVKSNIYVRDGWGMWLDMARLEGAYNTMEFWEEGRVLGAQAVHYETTSGPSAASVRCVMDQE